MSKHFHPLELKLLAGKYRIVAGNAFSSLLSELYFTKEEMQTVVDLYNMEINRLYSKIQTKQVDEGLSGKDADLQDG